MQSGRNDVDIVRELDGTEGAHSSARMSRAARSAMALLTTDGPLVLANLSALLFAMAKVLPAPTALALTIAFDLQALFRTSLEGVVIVGSKAALDRLQHICSGLSELFATVGGVSLARHLGTGTETAIVGVRNPINGAPDLDVTTVAFLLSFTAGGLAGTVASVNQALQALEAAKGSPERKEHTNAAYQALTHLVGSILGCNTVVALMGSGMKDVPKALTMLASWFAKTTFDAVGGAVAAAEEAGSAVVRAAKWVGSCCCFWRRGGSADEKRHLLHQPTGEQGRVDEDADWVRVEGDERQPERHATVPTSSAGGSDRV